ncbi:RNA-directed DNA polymerase, eukaryota, reverse transcriptase zinc-binding domain protein [Tanacetum coccineum]|uniref:RNA-directed DNA polymerase, eukaryota, reverse transcriptase zinc-binding domain protein n=1 Tax=Tanacetum coccineum TaxID=301880 RepID=A0ABQ5GK82_9ASTR
MAHRNGNQASGSKPASSEYFLMESKGNDEVHTKNRFSVLLEDNVDVDMAGDQVTKEGNTIVNIFRESSKNINIQIQSLEKEIVSSNRCIGSTANKRAIALVENKMKETRLSRNLAMPGLYDEMYREDLMRIQELRTKKQMLEVDLFMENYEKNRIGLWRNLEDHKNITGCHPWVMLGDFNVTLYDGENTSKVNVLRDYGVQDFKNCVESLDMEDISMTGTFFIWIQKMKNPNLGILKKLDRIMGNCHFLEEFRACLTNFLPFLEGFLKTVKDNWNAPTEGYAMYVLARRLRLMKKHMRRLNRGNGNVFSNVKKLKLKLQEVQMKLNKDPDSRVLREEEMVCTNSCNSAMLDKERFLRQKYKIEWLKEVCGALSKKIGVEGETYPVDDPIGLFSKKISDIDALEMVKPVSNEDIKSVIFYIEDSKALGPDTFTSKFFKASWGIIGGDVCKAVKEFFFSGKMLGELNTTIISLVPKSKNPRKAFDYRPIACYNVVYKCISKAKRGLRQGNPVSPYMFTIVMKALNLMVKRQISLDNRRALDEFSLSYGLYPSIAKSTIYFGNVPNEVKCKILMVMPFNKRELPAKYLRVPLVCRRLSKVEYKCLVDYVKKKINDWRNKYMSYAGRYVMTLINLLRTSFGLKRKSIWALLVFPGKISARLRAKEFIRTNIEDNMDVKDCLHGMDVIYCLHGMGVVACLHGMGVVACHHGMVVIVYLYGIKVKLALWHG